MEIFFQLLAGQQIQNINYSHKIVNLFNIKIILTKSYIIILHVNFITFYVNTFHVQNNTSTTFFFYVNSSTIIELSALKNFPWVFFLNKHTKGSTCKVAIQGECHILWNNILEFFLESLNFGAKTKNSLQKKNPN